MKLYGFLKVFPGFKLEKGMLRKTSKSLGFLRNKTKKTDWIGLF